MPGIDASKFAEIPPVDQADAHTTAEEIITRYPGALKGKTILVTGVSPGGIGAATALALATGDPKLIILAGRDLAKVQTTADGVKSVNPSVETRNLELDLLDLNQVTAAAKSLSDVLTIDIIINNAGIMAPPYVKSKDGFESQFAANYLGHWQLTKILLPQLQKSEKGGVVVNISSQGHRLGGVHLDDFGYQDGATYDKWDGYGQAKSANVLHAIELQRRKLVYRAIAVSPGDVQTNLLKEEAKADIIALFGLSDPKEATWLKSPSAGASTGIWAALEMLKGGLEDVKFADHCRPTVAAKHAEDAEVAKSLWEKTETLVNGVVKA